MYKTLEKGNARPQPKDEYGDDKGPEIKLPPVPERVPLASAVIAELREIPPATNFATAMATLAASAL